MFDYINKIDLAVKIPQNILTWLDSYPTPAQPENNFNISRQVAKMVFQDHPMRMKPVGKDFPIKISYQNESIMLTSDMYREIKTSTLSTVKNFGLTGSTKYSRIELPDELKKEIIDCLPEILKSYNPTPVLQIIDGIGMPPHSDFNRKSSLYYLLTDNNCSTMWFESNGPISLHEHANKYGFFYSIADLNNTKLKKTVSLDKNTWYVFDNYSFHAIKSNDGPMLRKGLQIEFNELLAKDLYVALLQQ
jgi:hypothetical protein